MAIINFGHVGRTIENVKKLMNERSSAIAPSLSNSNLDQMISQGVGDSALSNYMKSIEEGPNDNFVWAFHTWGSKTYKVSK